MLFNLLLSTVATSQLLFALAANAANGHSGVTFWKGKDHQHLKKYCATTKDERLVVGLEVPDCYGKPCEFPWADLQVCRDNKVQVFIDGNSPVMTLSKMVDLLEDKKKNFKFAGVYLANADSSTKEKAKVIIDSKFDAKIIATIAAYHEVFEPIFAGASEIEFEFLGDSKIYYEHIDASLRLKLPLFATTKDGKADEWGLRVLEYYSVPYNTRERREGPQGLKEIS